MLFRVLGSFEVVRAGAVVTPAAPRLRRLLALLAVRANTSVHCGQLTRELWGDRPPSDSGTILQTYLYQLRKLLRIGAQDPAHLGGRTEPSVALYACPSRYELHIVRQSLDLYRFESLLAQGRVAHAHGRLARAAGLLDVALGIWRGPALDGLTRGPLLHAEAVRLEAGRRHALALRHDAGHRLGGHAGSR